MDAKRWHAAILGAVALICLAILGWVSTARCRYVRLFRQNRMGVPHEHIRLCQKRISD